MDENQSPEPWYGVRLIYKHTGFEKQAYEERVLIVRADSFAAAIRQAEEYSKEYEDEKCQYVGHAMGFHIFDETGPCVGPGVEVFSLMRESNLDVEEYLDRFHDTGSERARHYAEDERDVS
ncbi:MAG TPA: DUF4288 domain-containing protein [Pirellulales bacterium]|nr:DUF4288 domain-containing protein [Pirellulales bacterium]